jgi:hypothetical protein
MVENYIIMCGGDYGWEKPRQLSVVNGEVLVERTIKLLKECGVKNISISTNNHEFDYLGVPILNHENNYKVEGSKVISGGWYNAFYPTDEPTCYIFGDVYFSPKAIKTIVETDTDDIELFGSKKPFAKNYMKTHEEPFALKVANQKHLRKAIEKTRELDKQNKFWRRPLVWELFTVIKNAPLQTKRDCYTTDYVGISDYTCDIDRKYDIIRLETILGGNMVKLECTYEFTLKRFNELFNITRKNADKKADGLLYVGDTFECSQELADYLLGNNQSKIVVAKVLEVIPEVQIISQSPVDELKKGIEKSTKTITTATYKSKRTKKSKK